MTQDRDEHGVAIEPDNRLCPHGNAFADCPDMLCAAEHAALPTRPLLAMTGEDGNAVAILARAKRAAFKAGWGIDQITAMVDEATSGDYDHLLATMIRRFETC